MSLLKFLLKRALQGVLVVWGVITIVFGLRFVTPGNPINSVVPLDAGPELRAQIAAELGLDKPIPVQYVDYLAGLLQGDLGYSYVSGTEASVKIFARLPATLELAFAGAVVAVVIAIPLGVISATRRNEPADYGATTFSLIGISMPNFWLGVMLVLLLAVQFDVFPTSRRPIGLLPALELLVGEFDPDGLITWVAHITLPAITLGTYFTAMITRLTRSGMLDELSKGYVRAARAKGLPEALVRYKHALRNTLIPIVTVLGLQLGTLIGGSVVTESVFAWPGFGLMTIQAINQRDWPIIQGALIVVGVGFVVVNILVDLLYARLDPRVVYD